MSIVSCNMSFAITHLRGHVSKDIQWASLMAKHFLPASYLLFGCHDTAGLPLFFHSGFLLPAPLLTPNLSGCYPSSNHVSEFCHFGTKARVWELSFFGHTDFLVFLVTVITPVPHHCLR